MALRLLSALPSEPFPRIAAGTEASCCRMGVCSSAHLTSEMSACGPRDDMRTSWAAGTVQFVAASANAARLCGESITPALTAYDLATLAPGCAGSVKSSMIAGPKKLKVLDAVVVPLSILVVDMLPARQSSPQVFFHDDPMLKTWRFPRVCIPCSSVNCATARVGGIQGASHLHALPFSSTGTITVMASRASNSRRRSVQRNTAGRASDILEFESCHDHQYSFRKAA